MQTKQAATEACQIVTALVLSLIQGNNAGIVGYFYTEPFPVAEVKRNLSLHVQQMSCGLLTNEAREERWCKSRWLVDHANSFRTILERGFYHSALVHRYKQYTLCYYACYNVSNCIVSRKRVRCTSTKSTESM
jgi:hypothetical protein